MSEDNIQKVDLDDIQIDNIENVKLSKAWVRGTNNRKKYTKTKNRPKMKSYTCRTQHVGNNIGLVFRSIPREEEKLERKKVESTANGNETNGDSDSNELPQDLINFIHKSMADESMVNEVLQGASDYLKNFSSSNDNGISKTMTDISTTAKSSTNDQFAFQVHMTEKDVNELMQVGKIFFFEGKLCYKNK